MAHFFFHIFSTFYLCLPLFPSIFILFASLWTSPFESYFYLLLSRSFHLNLNISFSFLSCLLMRLILSTIFFSPLSHFVIFLLAGHILSLCLYLSMPVFLFCFFPSLFWTLGSGRLQWDGIRPAFLLVHVEMFMFMQMYMFRYC